MAQYDIIHFEALGAEAGHLEEETKKALAKGLLPGDLTYLIVPEDLQTCLKARPDLVLPDIITTKTHSVLPEDYLKGKKKSVVTRSAGYDHFEHLAAVINLASLREYCVNAVAQTAVKFLYAEAGMLNEYTNNTLTFERNRATSFVELGKHLIATVFGCGKIGKRTYELLEGNGLTVQAVDVRREELSTLYGDGVKFVTKEEAIATSDILVNTMNLTKNPQSRFYNAGYFSEDYLSAARKKLFFINVTRGEIAPEAGLLKLYDAGKLLGIGLDVFSREAVFSEGLKENTAFDDPDNIAAREILNRAINRSANFYVQPHQGFNSDLAAIAKAEEAVKHLCAWYGNGKEKFDEQLPYYEG
ncbi:MAG: hydroxyacid dehydrogenase [Fusobacteriaceae bacterium]|jgi:D-lactate dehydrogenase|nr:hydroxyacid dehydrogenase [Fusobacteriaceae bacterium]